jgi:uncharacterized pyridoxamine 5'-phosphate oxidase family protein
MDKRILRKKKTGLYLSTNRQKNAKPIVKELKNYKEIVLVDIKAEDGTEVKVRL